MIFSVIIILMFQGGLSLLAVQIQNLVSPTMINEISPSEMPKPSGTASKAAQILI